MNRRQLFAVCLLPFGLIGGPIVRLIEKIDFGPNFMPRYGRGVFDYEWRDGTLWTGYWPQWGGHWTWSKVE